ncbi:MAG TPA: hypothetical protein V6C81_19815 [Planktothrix sp.]|jgi:hypothetical protein
MRTSVRAFSNASIGGIPKDKPVLPEIEFMRLSTSWQESAKDATFCGAAAFGGRMYQRMRSKCDRETYIDFSFRGALIPELEAQAFANMIKEPRAVAEYELCEIAGVLGQTLGARECGRFVNTIESADVGSINGRLVLAIHWHHHRFDRRVISIYFDSRGDGQIVREIHFSTPADLYEVSHKTFYETMRSAQWSCVMPPPITSVA